MTVVDRIHGREGEAVLHLIEPPIPLQECERIPRRVLAAGSLLLFFSPRIPVGLGRFGPPDDSGNLTIHAEEILRESSEEIGDEERLLLRLSRTPVSATLAADWANRASVAGGGLEPEGDSGLVFAVDETALASDVVYALEACAELAGHPFSVCFLLSSPDHGAGAAGFLVEIPMSSMEDVIQVDPPHWQGSYVSEEQTVTIRMTTRVEGGVSSGGPSYRVGAGTSVDALAAADRISEIMRRGTTSRVLFEVRDGVLWRFVADFATRCVCCGASELWMGPMYR